MSFSKSSFDPNTMDKIDNWMVEVGVPVPYLRLESKQAAAPGSPAKPTAPAPDRKPSKISADAYFADKAKAEPAFKTLDAEVLAAKPRPLVEAAAEAYRYTLISHKLARAEASKNYDLATSLLQDKVAAAALVKPVQAYLDGPTARTQVASIKAADLCLATTSGGAPFVKYRKGYDDACKTWAAAEKALDFKAAEKARTDAATLADTISETHQHLFKIKLFEPLMARADAMIKNDASGTIPDAFRASYETIKAAVLHCRDTGDFSTWDEECCDLFDLNAKSLLDKFNSESAEDWFEEGTKPKKKGIKQFVSGLRGRKQSPSSTNPIFKSLSDREKLDAIRKVVKTRSVCDIEKLAKTSFKRLKSEGLEWDLSPVELAALCAYTTDAYKDMNALLRDQATGKTPTAPPGTDALVALACEALAKLPQYDPVGFPLFRFEKIYATNLEDRYKPGTTFTVAEFWSSGAGRGADLDGAADAEIVIWGKKGSGAKTIGPISAFPAEGVGGAKLKGQGTGEVLLPPGSKFKTVFRKDLGESGELMKMRGHRSLRYRIEVMEL